MPKKKEKPFWFKFEVSKWQGDEKLGKCQPATRGIWIDMLCAMHKADRCGVLTGSAEQLARVCRCTKPEIIAAIEDLKVTKTADVTFCNADVTKKYENVTVVNRKMKSEFKTRLETALRVAKHRGKVKCNANVPGRDRDRVKDRVKEEKEKEEISTTSVYENLDKKQKLIFEMFRRALLPRDFPDAMLLTEIGKFQNRYPDVVLSRAGALVNAWTGNLMNSKYDEKVKSTSTAYEPTEREKKDWAIINGK